MKQLSLYLKSALYNIRQNKAYAIFCTGGTALTFIFITIVLHLSSIVNNNTAPAIHADHTLYVSSWQRDSNGQGIIYIDSEASVNLMKHVKDYDAYAIVQMQPMNLIINEQVKTNIIYFVNAGYWKVFQFDFIEGRPFTEKDYQTPVIVITESCAKRYFKNGSAIDQQIEFQGNTYKVIGVVADFSMIALTAPSSIWAPYTYNQFFPNDTRAYELYVSFPDQFTREQINQNMVSALRFYNQQRGVDINIPVDLYSTIQENKQTGNSGLLMVYGSALIIFLLLIIPAVNIVTLSITNTANRSEEIGIRRALGANRTSSFFQIMTENLILVLTGTLIGLILVHPIFDFINSLLQDTMPVEGFSLLPGLNTKIILLGILPLSILFSLLSGGLPAYIITKRNITDTLKGGSKC